MKVVYVAACLLGPMLLLQYSLVRGEQTTKDALDVQRLSGPSFSTVYCQQRVYEDAKEGTYNAIDLPVDVLNVNNLTQYGETFQGVNAVELPPGVVTPPWEDSDGVERGTAVLWIPEGVARESPKLLFIHGGGWTSGSPTTDGYAPFAAKIAKIYQFPILVIDYTLVPIGNFEVIMKEVGMAAKFLASHEPLDLEKGDYNEQPVEQSPPIFILGDSSGGGSALSALVAQASPKGIPEADGARLAGGVLFSPWINLESDGPTYFSQLFGIHKKGNVLLGDVNFGWGSTPNEVVESNRRAARMYSKNLRDPIANPMYASDQWLSNLAPISLHAGMPELLQSDATLFATKAAKAGAPRVEAHVFDGMWHVFEMYMDGCGSGEPVVLANSSLNFGKRFIDGILSDNGKPTRSFCFMPHYESPRGQDSASGLNC